MREYRLYSVFSLLAILIVFSGCYQVDNELEDLTIYNPADIGTGEELVGVDSIHASSSKVEFFLHVNWDKIKDTSKVHRIRVHRIGAPFAKEMSPGEFHYFVDINVNSNTTYYYQFAILTEDRKSSKKTRKYKVNT